MVPTTYLPQTAENTYSALGGTVEQLFHEMCYIVHQLRLRLTQWLP
jgi:hypothetical protein